MALYFLNAATLVWVGGCARVGGGKERDSNLELVPLPWLLFLLRVRGSEHHPHVGWFSQPSTVAE